MIPTIKNKQKIIGSVLMFALGAITFYRGGDANTYVVGLILIGVPSVTSQPRIFFILNN